MSYKISIIIPCYNCQGTLAEAVKSCYVQGFDANSFEIVMVDDRSTDGTRVLMDELARKNTNIRCFSHEKNLGGGATRNTAAQQAEADVIFCLDGDDILPADTLMKMYTYLKEKGCDGVTVHKSIKFVGGDIQDVDYIDESPFVNEEIPVTSLISKNDEFCPVYVNFMYTKEAFKKAGMYPTSHGFDTQGFAWRFLCAGLKARTCPETTYLHRIKMNKSYYLREYEDGKANYNWRNILLEHYYVFNKKALDFIIGFDCSDFTHSLTKGLAEMDSVFVSNIKDELGKRHDPLDIKLKDPVYIKTNSFRGYYLRIKNKLKKVL